MPWHCVVSDTLLDKVYPLYNEVVKIHIIPWIPTTMKIKITTLRRVNSISQMIKKKVSKTGWKLDSYQERTLECNVQSWNRPHSKIVSESHSKDIVEICKLSIHYQISVIQVLYH